jgi:hypothetical protein
MQIIEQSAGERAPLPQVASALPVSPGWLIRRAVLWMACVTLGVAAACLLYMVASKAEAESLARNTEATMPVSHQPAQIVPTPTANRL